MHFRIIILLLSLLLGDVSKVWGQPEIKLTASDGENGDFFGYSVSLSGDYALMGAFLDDNNEVDTGSAYVYRREGATWVEEVKLTASDADRQDRFGVSVSLNGDYALVGAHWDDDNGVDSGSAYVYRREGSTWVEQAKLTASDGAQGDEFGVSVSLNGDYALVGAHWDDDNGNNSGSVYVYRREGSTWVEEAKLTASSGAQEDGFGASVSLNGDYALVGAFLDDFNGVDSGSAYVYRREGTTWVEEAKLTASDGTEGGRLGISVSLNKDYALVGAFLDDFNGVDSGSVYVYKREGTTWVEEAKLTASDGAQGDQFGVSVSLNGDHALVGARLNDDNGSNSGSAYVFRKENNAWIEEVRLISSKVSTDDRFGVSVSLSEDHALVGAYRDDDTGTDSGSAYVYELSLSSESVLMGSMKDVSFNDQLGNMDEVSLPGAIVEVYDNGILIAQAVTDASGSYSIKGVETGRTYNVKVSATGQVETTGETVVIDQEFQSTTDLPLDAVIPLGLTLQKKKILDELSDLHIRADLLLTEVSIPLLLDYKVEGAETEIERWLTDMAFISEQQTEAIVRLYMAEIALQQTFENSATMSHEIAESIFALVKGYLATKQVLDHIYNSLIAQNGGLGDLVIEGAYRAGVKLATEIWLSIPVKYMAARLQSPYGELIEESFQFMIGFASSEGEIKGSIIDHLKDAGLETGIVVGVDYIFLQSYVLATRSDLNAAVDQTSAQSYTGSLESAFQQSISLETQDEVESVLEVSNALTEIRLEQSNILQLTGDVTDKVSTISGFLSVVPGPQTPVLKTLSGILRGISLGSYLTSVGISGGRLWNILGESESATQTAFNPDNASKRSNVYQKRYEQAFYSDAYIVELQQALKLAQDAYIELLEEIVRLANAGQKEQALIKIDSLAILDATYDAQALVSVSPVLAVAAEATQREGFDESYADLLDATGLSAQERLVFYGLLLDYSLRDDFNITDLEIQVEAIKLSFSEAASAVSTTTAEVGDLPAPPFVVVTSHNASEDLVNEKPFVISATVKNLGATSANDISIWLEPDSSTSIVSLQTVQVAELEVSDSLSIVWNVVISDTSYVTTGYRVGVEVANGRSLGATGTLTRRSSITNVSNQSSPDLPVQFVLHGNYPNPFSEQTTISYSLPATTPVHLSVYDLLGREVVVLIDAIQQGGKHQVGFEASTLPSGMYIYRLETSTGIQTGKMMLKR